MALGQVFGELQLPLGGSEHGARGGLSCWRGVASRRSNGRGGRRLLLMLTSMELVLPRQDERRADGLAFKCVGRNGAQQEIGQTQEPTSHGRGGRDHLTSRLSGGRLDIVASQVHRCLFFGEPGVLGPEQGLAARAASVGRAATLDVAMANRGQLIGLASALVVEQLMNPSIGGVHGMAPGGRYAKVTHDLLPFRAVRLDFLFTMKGIGREMGPFVNDGISEKDVYVLDVQLCVELHMELAGT